MTEIKSITFFIDRCLGSKVLLEKLKAKGITVVNHDDHFNKDAPDVEWISFVGKQGWIVLTKDKNIGKNPLERRAVTRANTKMFTFASQDITVLDMIDILLNAISSMQDFIQKYPSPFIAKIYRDGKIKMWKDSQTLLQELEVKL